MGLMAAIVRELVTAGVTGNALVTAVERIEAEIERPPSTARDHESAHGAGISNNAMRQRRWRERKAASSVTGVTDNVTSVTDVTQKENPPHPLKKKHLLKLPSLFNSDCSEESKEEEVVTRARARAEFDFWYDGYPHKIGKQAAIAAFARARRSASVETLVAGRNRYIRTKPPDRAWCNPATWLNQGRWDDQPAILNGGFSGQHRQSGNGRSAGSGFVVADMLRRAAGAA